MTPAPEPSAEAREQAERIVSQMEKANLPYGPCVPRDRHVLIIARALAEKDAALAHEHQDALAWAAKCGEADGEVTALRVELAEARRERDEARGYEAQKEAWDVRGFVDALKGSGLDAITHEDGWALTTPTVLDGMKAQIAALQADLVVMRRTLVRLLGELSCCYACDGPDRDDEELRHNEGCYVAAALASSPGAAWLATAREVVEALQKIIYASDQCYGHRDCGHSMEPWQRARALLARPEV